MDQKNPLTFKERWERFYRRYILLRLKNKVFVTAWLTLLFAQICGFNKITATSIMAWPDLYTVMWGIITNPVQMLTLVGTTFVSFINPISRGVSDKDLEMEDPRLKELEIKMGKIKEEVPKAEVSPPAPSSIPVNQVLQAPVDPRVPREPSVVEVKITKK